MTHWDVVILGASFSGSLIAAILAKNGLNVALVDSATHPRFAIGESSTPSADLILSSLVQDYELDELAPLCRYGSWTQTYPEIRCGCKRGFSYVWHGGDSGYQATANHNCELLVTASESNELADTQWYRTDIDQFIFEQAINLGASDWTSSTIETIQHVEPQSWSLAVTRAGQTERMRADFLIDTSGASGVLLSSLDIADVTQLLRTNTAAVFSHFDHVPSCEDWLAQSQARTKDFPYSIDHSAVHHVTEEGWLWQLRFRGGPTSVGFVTTPDSSEFREMKPIFETGQWDHPKNRFPASLFGGSQCSSIPGQVFSTGRLQRLRESGAGPDWAALPSTVGFIDPLHSTGIAHSLSGIQRLAKIILSGNSTSAREQLQAYSQSILTEHRLIDEMVSGCYRSLWSFELFSAWTMVYFAAATTFEKNYNSGRRDFLCSDDSSFLKTVSRLSQSLDQLNASGRCEKRIVEHLNFLRDQLAPYNHVGLFEPSIPGMYARTAAEKT
ncbi:Tryptophan halogenase [Thalassoglobus neptunius]|uniref:Tryptophan halogenase n=1 Tax=Thalassoglobus neptunius TaxID=1938619 RepID=A0A5C5WB58_9PLAN|nr:Tryptophan halogenase [Thalassoglobus neptunius]